jgi:hypothetical protein
MYSNIRESPDQKNQGVNMSSKRSKKELVGIWRSLHGVIWVVGLYVLITRNFIFPGILILIAISAIYEGVLQRFVPDAYQEQVAVEEGNSGGTSANPAPTMTPPAPPEHRIELLPQVCPNCNAPIRGHEVKWTGPQSANCSYCGTNLPMNKA